MGKPAIAPEQIENILRDFSIYLGEHSESQRIDLENEVRKCAVEYCTYVSPDVLKLVLYAANEAYFQALKSVELALRSTLREIFEIGEE